MWFRSSKEFKENTMLLVTIARFTTYSFKDMDRAINHNEREAFVDAWLNEPPIDKRFKLIPIIYMKDPFKVMYVFFKELEGRR